MPPGLAGGTGPASVPGHMAGAAAQGSAKLKTAVELLQSCLAIIPLGSDAHGDVLKAVTMLAKHVGESGSGPQASGQDMVQQLAALARQQQAGGGSNPLAGMTSGGAGAPTPPPPAE